MAPPLPTPTGVLRLRFLYDNGVSGAFGHSADFGYTGGPPDTASMNAIAAAVQGFYVSDLLSLLPDGMALNHIEVRDLAHPSVIPGEGGARVVGTRTGGILALSTCTVLNFKPNRSYRGAKPKSFTPWGVDTDLNDQTTWKGTYITEVGDAWGTFQDDIATITSAGTTLGAQVGISYIEGPYTATPNSGGTRYRIKGTPRNPPLVMDIVSVSVQRKVGAQRRRILAVG